MRLSLSAAVLVSLDHGPALRRLGVRRLRFVTDVVRSADPLVTAILAPASARARTDQPIAALR